MKTNMEDLLTEAHAKFANNTVATLVSKCERYKKLYFEIQKKLNKQSSPDELSDIEDDTMAGEENDTLNMTTQSPGSKSAKAKEYEKRIRDLEQQLQDVRDNYKTLKAQYEYYSQEKKNNEKILNEQFDSMRTEVRELTSTNCKLVSSLEYTKSK
ncbi:Nucleoprotein TPR [Eumeta japonica]|uniref:Nucleoprotein TPR n=1 Tax=Eumeta variegata TaxID=151549 RepID=A0A4C1SUC8_EUMVA|nr:Nucleoprotein TPR [Eumeta japonica]